MIEMTTMQMIGRQQRHLVTTTTAAKVSITMTTKIRQLVVEVKAVKLMNKHMKMLIMIFAMIIAMAMVRMGTV